VKGLREKLEAALAKPQPDPDMMGDIRCFDPWEDVIHGIYGNYNSECDDLMIAAMKSVRDKTTFEFIKDRGFVAEFALYVLAGHQLTDYGTSPRGGWPDFDIEDLWQPLIDKWEAHAKLNWGEDWNESKGGSDSG